MNVFRSYKMQLRFLCVLVIAVVAVCDRTVSGQTSGSSALKPTLISLMRTEYLSTEDTLWAEIAGGMEPSYVLQQIHSGHSRFLTRDFHVYNCYLSTFDPEQHVIRDAVLRILNAANNTANRYLHTSRRLYNEEETLEVSTSNRDLSKHLDKIYEITGLGDFYYTTRRVSVVAQANSFSQGRNRCDNDCLRITGATIFVFVAMKNIVSVSELIIFE